MNDLAMTWVNARIAHLLAVRRMTPVEVGNDQQEWYDTDKDSPLCIPKSQKHWNLLPPM